GPPTLGLRGLGRQERFDDRPQLVGYKSFFHTDLYPNEPVLLGTLSACRSDPGEPRERRLDCGERFRRATAAPTKEGPIRLVGCVLGEEVAPGEAVQLVVGVLNLSNAPLQAHVRLDLLDVLHITVVAPSGDTLKLPYAWEPFDLNPEHVTFA